MKYGDAFKSSFLESLNEPIEILETDDEETVALKKEVQATKEDLKKRMEAGEDVVRIVNETLDEYRRLGAYRHELEVTLAEIRNNPEEYTDKDVLDFTEAANKMLKEHDLPPLALPRVIMRSLRKGTHR